MARKGNQHRNGLNHTISNQRHVGSAAASNEKTKAHDGPILDRTLLDSDCGFGPGGVSVENMNNTTSSSKRKKHRIISMSSSEKSDDKVSGSEQPEADCGGNDLLSDDPESKGDDETLFQCDYSPNSSAGQTFAAMREANVRGKARWSESVAYCHIRALMLRVTRKAEGWVERQRPHLRALTALIHKGQSYARDKIEQASPVILGWIQNAGRLMLIIMMVWLDCSIRGLDSLLRMGTTSFFTVLWCSILSVGAMIGLKMMIIFMVVVASVAAFIGLGLAILITSISAIVILWLYGSFWTTSLVILLGGSSFALKHERVALLVTTIYSVHCARSYVGWLGLFLGLNLSFISSDVLIHFLKNMDAHKMADPSEAGEQTQGRGGNFYREHSNSSPLDDAFQYGYGGSADRGPGDPSTSGTEKEVTSEDEVLRLLNCTDHYSALGLPRYGHIDMTLLKREYRKKAMLVHPDKNMGNENAADAFKKLQNAYEVLLDSLKRKTYDDELRREELLNYFRRLQNASPKKGRNGIFWSGFSRSEGVDENFHGESRRIACKKCGNSHLWTCTGRSKLRARWCQDCKDFHQAKDGDGWVEQSFQPLLFGLLQKMDEPCTYVCAESRIYDVTEWFKCQGMRCTANTHKPSFHVNSSLAKQSNSKGSSSSHRAGGMPGPSIDEPMTEDELFEWLQNAMQSEMVFEMSGTPNDGTSTMNTGVPKSGVKKKRKGKKQW